MALAIVTAIAFLALVMWRSLFAGSLQRHLVRVIATRHERHSNFLGEVLHISGLGVVVDPVEDDPDRLNPKERAIRNLRRIVAVTGARQVDDGYVVEVGKMRFHVRDRYIKRLRDTTDPKCAFEETCFYPVHKDMPKAEQIATALIQLRNNPGLFKKWAAQSGPYKADGQAFTPGK
jgi:hypothetical protein